MSQIVIISIALVGISALATFFVVGRQMYRRYWSERLASKAKELRKKIEELHHKNFEGVNKVFFDMRDQYPPELIQDELERFILDKRTEAKGLREPFKELGILDKYLGELRTAKAWRRRCTVATTLGLLNAVEAVPLLLESMRDINEDGDVKLASAEALATINDPAVIPKLCEELAHVDSWATPRLSTVLANFGSSALPDLIKVLEESDDANSRVWAAQILGAIGDRKATPSLIERLHDPSGPMRMSVSDALGKIGDSRAMRPLTDVILRDLDPSVRAQAAKALGEIGDEESLPLLLGALGDPEYWVRYRALDAIESLNPSDTSAIEKALKDSSTEVRKRAALALERTGIIDKDFDDLISNKEDVFHRAQKRLTAIGQAGLSERFLRQLEDESPLMRKKVAELIGFIGDPHLARDLAERLTDESIEVRIETIRSLGILSSEDTTLSLVPYLFDENTTIRNATVESLLSFGQDELLTIKDTLMEKAKTHHDPHRLAVVSVLRGIQDEQLGHFFFQLLSDRSVEIRLLAAKQLGVLKSKEAVPLLGPMLSDRFAPLRVAAAETLGQLKTEEAFKYLLNALNTADPQQRDSICQTMAEEGYRAALPVIDFLMASSKKEMRLAVTWILGKTGDPKALPLLREFLQDSDPSLRASSAGALGKIDCPTTGDILLIATSDPNPRVRSAAINALGNVGAPAHLKKTSNLLMDPDAFTRHRCILAFSHVLKDEAFDHVVSLEHSSMRPEIRTIALALSETPQGKGMAISALAKKSHSDLVTKALCNESKQLRMGFYDSIYSDLKLTTHDKSEIEIGEILDELIQQATNRPLPEHRANAVEVLSHVTHDRAKNALLDIISKEPTSSIRKDALRALQKYEIDFLIKEVVLAGLFDPDIEVRTISTELAATFASTDEATPILFSLKNPAPSLQAASISALSQIYKNKPHLFQAWLLNQSDASILLPALKVVEKMKDSTFLDSLEQLSKHEDSAIRSQASRASIATDTKETIELAQLLLKDPVPFVRKTTVLAFMDSQRESTLQDVASLASDPSEEVRLAVVTLFEKSKSASALVLLDKMTSDPLPTIREKSFWSLFNHPDLDSVHHLQKILKENTDFSSMTTEERVEKSLPKSNIVMKHPDSELRLKWIHVLSALSTEKFCHVIRGGLSDPAADVRLAALNELSKLGDSMVEDWLKELLNDPVKEIRDVTRKRLFKIV